MGLKIWPVGGRGSGWMDREGVNEGEAKWRMSWGRKKGIGK